MGTCLSNSADGQRSTLVDRAGAFRSQLVARLVIKNCSVSSTKLLLDVRVACVSEHAATGCAGFAQQQQHQQKLRFSQAFLSITIISVYVRWILTA